MKERMKKKKKKKKTYIMKCIILKTRKILLLIDSLWLQRMEEIQVFMYPQW
jgi:hypothetical protein